MYSRFCLGYNDTDMGGISSAPRVISKYFLSFHEKKAKPLCLAWHTSKGTIQIWGCRLGFYVSLLKQSHKTKYRAALNAKIKLHEAATAWKPACSTKYINDAEGQLWSRTIDFSRPLISPSYRDYFHTVGTICSSTQSFQMLNTLYTHSILYRIWYFSWTCV